MALQLEKRRSRRVARSVGWATGSALAAVTLLVSGEAAAQAPGQPPPPPPGFEQQPAAGQQPPPPGYGPPAGGYYTQPPPQYGYAPPPSMMVGPKELDYEDGDPVPPGYHVDTKIRKGLVIGGSVTFGTLYLLSALTAAVAQDVGADSYTPLYVPGIGPFITIGTVNASGSGAFTLVLDGIAQTGGIVMAVVGIAMPRSVLLRNDVGTPSVRLAPVALGNGNMGLGLVGSM